MFKKMFVTFSLVLVAAGAAAAQQKPDGDAVIAEATVLQSATESTDQRIPEIVPVEHWAYTTVADLVEKYGGEYRLHEGQPCRKDELIDSFVAALTKVVEKYKKEGGIAVSRDDIESIRALVVALEDELFKEEAYLTLRVTIERVLALAEPPVPIYKYKVGVNGFIRGDGVSNFRLPDASYSPEHSEGRFVYRVKPFAYWHPNQYFDIHVEGQGYGYSGGSQEAGKGSIYQGFVEAKLPVQEAPGRYWVSLKAGRQEFEYGSAFILGTNAFYDGHTFDAVRLRVQPATPRLRFLTLDLLSGKYAVPFSDGLKGDLRGAYLTYGPAEDNTIEAYAFRDTGAEERHAGERVDTLGYRSTGAVGIFATEHELVYVTGKVFNPDAGVNDTIAAFGGHIDLTGDFQLRPLGKVYDSSVFISFAMGSGDENAANGVGSNKGEFRQANHDSPLMGDMGVVGDLSGFDVGDHHASGMKIYTLGWGIDLTKKLNVSATGRKFVADKVETGFSREIGVETDLTLAYEPNKDYTYILGYDRFFTGKFFRDASGSDKDIDYVYAMLVFNYDWTKRKM
jgi:alginate export protein